MIASFAIPLCLIYWFLFLRSEVRHDSRRIKAERYGEIKHGKRWRFRALVMSPVVAGLTIALEPRDYDLIWAPIISTGVVGFGWLNCFDGWLNRSRNKGWWYTGTDDERDSNTDNFLQSLTRWQHIAFKMGTVAISVGLYVYLLVKHLCAK